MKQILLFDAHSLRNDEHAQFHSDVYKQMMIQTAVKLGITNLIAAYETALTTENVALQQEQGSAFTKTITEADAWRDQLEHGLDLRIESALSHYDAEMQESARKVSRIWNQSGDLRRLPYNEESSAIANRNQELKNNYSTDLQTLGIVEWMDKDEEANNDFINHFGSRANEEAARISGNVKDARILVDPAYTAIVTRINALVVVNGEDDYAEFVNQVNYYINYYKNTIAARKGRKKTAESKTVTE